MHDGRAALGGDDDPTALGDEAGIAIDALREVGGGVGWGFTQAPPVQFWVLGLGLRLSFLALYTLRC